MFKSVRIQNFRQFRDLKLDGLAQINLITGKNNTGKTSLLEALWICKAAPVDPGVVAGVARVRGIDKIGLEGPSSWGWIFLDHKREDGISFESVQVDGHVERVQLRASPDLIRQVLNGDSALHQGRPNVVSTAEVPILSLQVTYTDQSGVVHDGSLNIIGENALPRPAITDSSQRWYFLSNKPGDPEIEAQNFDQLVLAGREGDIVGSYRLIDNRIKDVQSLDPGTGRRIYARTFDGKLLPTAVMGHGFYRMGKIATAIVSASGGVAMIDEFDDGLHYSALVDAWRYVIELAARHSVQLFATTHSLECINAAAKASEGHEDKLALFRLSRRDDDIRATRVEHEGIQAAVDFAFELR